MKVYILTVVLILVAAAGAFAYSSINRTQPSPVNNSDNKANNNFLAAEKNKPALEEESKMDNIVYKINLEESRLEWAAQKIFVRTNDHVGSVDIKSGFLNSADGKLSGGEVVVDMTTIQDKDLSGGSKKTLENHLKSDDFFGVEIYPEAKLTFISFELSQSDNIFNLTADLTIRDKTNRVSFPAQIEVRPDKIEAQAELTIDRSLWDVRYGSDNFFKGLGDNVIDDNIKFKIKIVAEA